MSALGIPRPARGLPTRPDVRHPPPSAKDSQLSTLSQDAAPEAVGFTRPLALEVAPTFPPAPIAVRKPSASVRAVTLAVVGLPFVGFLTAMALLWPVGGVSWIHLGLFFVGYILTGFGVTIGFHRLFTHKSFSTSRPMTFILGVLGSMAAEGPILSWVATHRCHHQHSDDDLDPHSPHHHGEGLKGLFKGFWHSHTGWMITTEMSNIRRYAPDLAADPLVRFIHRTFLVWLGLGLLLPGLIAWAVTGTIVGGLLGVLWGGLVRMFFVHHVTWSINSVCHIWGRAPYASNDESRNNVVCGVLGLGEGWHNNHHAFPASARHGLEWWQLDLSYITIRTMKALGLASNIKLPPKDRVEAKRRK
jgi:stearoyl-CoA desaturase (Delta-9 desaturase)